jgi:hypothetical protein
LATAHDVMDTLFDPDGDDLVGVERTPPGASRGRPVPAERSPAERSPVEPTSAQQTPMEHPPGRASRAGAGQPPQPLARASGGGLMLDDLVASLWEGLAAHGAVECPVCGSEMRPEYGARALPIGGRCGACGSTLA